jgi:hypothetical protein
LLCVVAFGCLFLLLLLLLLLTEGGLVQIHPSRKPECDRIVGAANFIEKLLIWQLLYIFAINSDDNIINFN